MSAGAIYAENVLADQLVKCDLMSTSAIEPVVSPILDPIDEARPSEPKVDNVEGNVAIPQDSPNVVVERTRIRSMFTEDELLTDDCLSDVDKFLTYLQSPITVRRLAYVRQMSSIVEDMPVDRVIGELLPLLATLVQDSDPNVRQQLAVQLKRLAHFLTTYGGEAGYSAILDPILPSLVVLLEDSVQQTRSLAILAYSAVAMLVRREDAQAHILFVLETLTSLDAAEDEQLAGVQLFYHLASHFGPAICLDVVLPVLRRFVNHPSVSFAIRKLVIHGLNAVLAVLADVPVRSSGFEELALKSAIGLEKFTLSSALSEMTVEERVAQLPDTVWIANEAAGISEDSFHQEPAVPLSATSLSAISSDFSSDVRWSEVVLRDIFFLVAQSSNYHLRGACVTSLHELVKAVRTDRERIQLREVYLRLSMDASRVVLKSALMNMGLLISALPSHLVSRCLFTRYLDCCRWSADDGSLTSKLEFIWIFTFPAILKTLGPAIWPQVREMYLAISQGNLDDRRHCLACSLHEVARLLCTDDSESSNETEKDSVGATIVVKELMPIFEQYICGTSDTDPSVTATIERNTYKVVRHMATFLRYVDVDTRTSLLMELPSIMSHWNQHNWRLRHAVARQFCELLTLVPRSVVFLSMSESLQLLLTDSVAIVRSAVVEAPSVLLSAMIHVIEFGMDAGDPLLLEETTESMEDYLAMAVNDLNNLATSGDSSLRLLWAQVAFYLLRDLPSIVWDMHFHDTLLVLSRDPVISVRLAVAETLTGYNRVINETLSREKDAGNEIHVTHGVMSVDDESEVILSPQDLSIRMGRCTEESHCDFVSSHSSIPDASKIIDDDQINITHSSGITPQEFLSQTLAGDALEPWRRLLTRADIRQVLFALSVDCKDIVRIISPLKVLYTGLPCQIVSTIEARTRLEHAELIAPDDTNVFEASSSGNHLHNTRPSSPAPSSLSALLSNVDLRSSVGSESSNEKWRCSLAEDYETVDVRLSISSCDDDDDRFSASSVDDILADAAAAVAAPSAESLVSHSYDGLCISVSLSDVETLSRFCDDVPSSSNSVTADGQVLDILDTIYPTQS